EVAMVIETVFGPRMRIRHEQIREVMRRADADSLLTMSGLPQRAPPTAEMRMSMPSAFASIAPPAPSARYTFGPSNDYAGIFPRRPPGGVMAGVGGGIAVGPLLVLPLFSRKPAAPPTPPVAVTSEPRPPPTPKTHSVRVPLPFISTLVTFD